MLPPHILFTALCIQLLYILVNWYFFRRQEYFYYSLYILVITFFFLNRYVGDDSGMIRMGSLSFPEIIPDRLLCICSYIFYFKFGRLFVDVKDRYPGIERMMLITEKVLIAFSITDLILLNFHTVARFESTLFMLVNIYIFIVLIFVFRAMLKKNELLDRFILTGSMFYAITAVITLWLGRNKNLTYNAHMLALQLGALVEMIFLNAGLVYKSRMLQQEKIQSQNQLIRQYENNQNLMTRLNSIRETISRDLHDDVGATLSSIKAYSEILKINPAAPAIADLIRDNSSEMIERLEMIAWSANPEHDQGKSLLIRLQQFAAPLCHAHAIHFQLTHSMYDEQIQIPGEIRQHVFLLFKESINNLIKYAKAKNCKVSISLNNRDFSLQIRDDGLGFDIHQQSDGNGLRNMKRRVDLLGGTFELNSQINQGTSILIRIPLLYRPVDA